ncbi:putative nuclear pore complex subunit Nup85 [Aspergillus clavatus NRRL 1]|uniref:Nuclear pore complex protein Nup85 n=1 Tax=Aspergillus clavatus (strain ATCC 1007 / CBS 513.65 / DSM 816 / NCTC 3887 / NRRL 1 / QM 1276 / 107) TaxID=344612 RepID=A1CG44_ASPCL|nr:uncharacterized protein ACLA_065580 [Aspergillus clavatus NRRL 1]EAW10924.1 conserved hypothetical protein [Aspergillus clavatus NRRL 1]
MSFQVPFGSSPSTPDKSRSLWSDVSATPADGPPSTTKSFTPRGPPPSTIYGGSQMSTRSQLDSPQSFFTKSGGVDFNDSIFNSSIGSTHQPAPRAKNAGPKKSFAQSQSLFGMANNTRFGESTSFGMSNGFTSHLNEEVDDEGDEDMLPEEEEDVEEEHGDMDIGDATDGSGHRLSFLDSQFGNSTQPQSFSLGQRKSIYSNPGNAKRPKLDEKWAKQSPLRKGKLSPKKDSAMPSIIRNLASRAGTAVVDEPSEIIISTEDEICRMYDEARQSEYTNKDSQVILSEVSGRLTATWATSVGPSNTETGIGPGDQASNVAKASFIGSLLLQLHHPPLSAPKQGSLNNPLGFAAPRSLALTSPQADTITPIPKVLLDWLEANHAPQTNELQILREVEPNPTASSDFWEIINAAVLRGRFNEAADLLRSADFNYARSALEDGLPQAGYRGVQLQNIQRCANKALQILESSPSAQYGDWDVKGTEWALYRKRVMGAVTDLEEFAEGGEQQSPEPPVSENRFQAINFGLKPSPAKGDFSFTKSARMAESRVPWTIYQNLRSLYRIILGDTSAIMSNAQDWIEATVGLTVWWDGEDDEEVASDPFGRVGMFKPQSFRGVNDDPVSPYLQRLDLALRSAINEASTNSGFRVNPLSNLEVGLASVFEGNVDGVLGLLQTWSLSIASAVAEVASLGGWLDTAGGPKTLPGLSENDLMVLSYGQTGNGSTDRIRKDDVLCAYALGLFDRNSIEHESGVRDGWELALEVLSRLTDAENMQKSVSELLDKLPLDTAEEMDKAVLLCSELGLDKEGRRVSERFGDQTVENSEDYGLALVCYARAHSRRKVKSVVDLLISYSLVQSLAYPASANLDEQLEALIRDPKLCLSAIAASDEVAADILQFYFSGYATLRRFFETRDETIGLKEGQRPRFKPLARRRAAAGALVAVISSAADSIYGGLYDPDRDSAVQVDGLLTLLGEALAFINQPTPILSVPQQFAILSAIEDLETVTPRVFAQCEECFRSTLIEYSSGRASSGGRSSAESYVLPPSPRALLKKSVSSLTASSTFSFIGSDMIESAKNRTMSTSGSISSSAVLVPRPGDEGHKGQERGWDWRAGLPEDIKGEEVLKILRLGLARGLSFGALGSV